MKLRDGSFVIGGQSVVEIRSQPSNYGTITLMPVEIMKKCKEYSTICSVITSHIASVARHPSEIKVRDKIRNIQTTCYWDTVFTNNERSICLMFDDVICFTGKYLYVILE